MHTPRPMSAFLMSTLLIRVGVRLVVPFASTPLPWLGRLLIGWGVRRRASSCSMATFAPIPCDVESFLVTEINQAQASKVIAWHNTLFNEIVWFYPGDTHRSRCIYQLQLP